MTYNDLSDEDLMIWARNYTKHAYALRDYKNSSGFVLGRGSRRARAEAQKFIERFPIGRPDKRSVKLSNKCGVAGTKHFKQIAKQIREIEKEKNK